jgi:hypothetical protein
MFQRNMQPPLFSQFNFPLIINNNTVALKRASPHSQLLLDPTGIPHSFLLLKNELICSMSTQLDRILKIGQHILLNL